MLTAGGTGGHVFPAEALADELLSRGRRVAVITDRRGQAFGGTLGGLETYRISAAGIAGRSLPARLWAVGELTVGLLQAYNQIVRQAPAAVVGFGGYASLPAMLAAGFARVPTALHEQNATLGGANRLLAFRVTSIATSFPQVGRMADPLREKAICTGMPVRSAVVGFREQPYVSPEEGGVFRVLILGGSQGARILSEVVPSALVSLPEDLRSRLSISQQCRGEDLDMVRQVYGGAGIHATLASFFHDIPARMADAHLVIARSGASTVAELTAIGRPAILVPYPHAVEDHQTANAHAVDEVGGGWLIPQTSFTVDSLRTRLLALMAMPACLVKAAACARAAGVPDAAVRLADLVDSLLTREKTA
jgi:UDP-N-acetylglucosamine--N-acetylmuramyl-(pentapeptide) pyrophosphoryl-undecaprenol N-acetylglucosamine transferase